MSTGPGRAPAGPAVRRVELAAVPGIGEVRPGDDLAALLLAALAAAGLPLRAGDLLAVASKVVAKAEGRYARDADGAGLDADAAVTAQTVRVVAQRLTPRGRARIVQSASGPVLAAAGVDASNLPPGQPPLALPADPDASARALRAALVAAGAPRVAVLVTDTLGRPWRVGQTDAAIGAAGLDVVQDLTGQPDATGRLMEVTVRAVADELAAAADLVKGKTTGLPLALVRGLGDLVTEHDGPGAAALLRAPDQDWFRLGHAEAARAALGLDPEDPRVPVQPVVPGTLLERLQRAVLVARIVPGPAPGPSSEPSPQPSPEPARAEVVRDGGDDRPAVRVAPVTDSPAGWAAAGALAQRILVAAWAEGVPLRFRPDPDAGAALTLVPSPGAD